MIRHGNGTLTPIESERRHAADRAFLESELEIAARLGQTAVDEQLGATQVVANPGGYTPAENPLFDPALCVEVGH